jgi:ABC-type transporter Mla subunit MlaD
MRRLLAVCLLLAAAAAPAFALAGRGDDRAAGNRFTVELDNAFGVVEGADVKIAGVRAGRVTGMRVDPRTTHALVDFEVTSTGFGSLRDDASCETRPQSLIGEYFVDCQPGTSPRELPAGGRIGIERTASTIPVDLINNIMRRPYRERLGIILSELGTGVGGRAGDLNDAIRRAVPALRETDRVLAILAEHNRVLADLTRDADTVIGDLAGNRRDVGRWVTKTRRTAAASAERREDIAGSLRRLPGFLREMRPTMTALGQAAEAQTPALQDLDAAAAQLTRLFEDLPPFAKATRTGLSSLADASRKGRPAIKASKPTIAQLGAAVAQLPEVSGNLAIVLAHLADRRFAVEKDPRSPGGQGYTGFEAILQYFYDQAMAINIYDANAHLLKVNLFESKCSDYQNVESLKEELEKDPSFYSDCAAILGPNQPGITTPDPTLAIAPPLADGGRELHAASRGKRERQADAAPESPEKVTAAEELRRQIEETLGITLPELPAGALPTLPSAGQAAPDAPVPDDIGPLLDFLLAP